MSVTNEISEQTQKIISDFAEGIYRDAYLALSKQLQLPFPEESKSLLGNPDKFLQAIIPPNDEESECKRRRETGTRIKALRRHLKLTQAEVAEKLGIAPQSVTNYESGKTDPSIRNLISLAAVLGTSTDYLLGRSVH